MKTKSLLLIGSLAMAAAQSQAASVVYTDFSNTSQLDLNGSAQTVGSGPGTVLRLTDDLGQSGSAFSLNTVTLQNASFSTFFSFRISDPQGISDEDGVGADGIVFTVQTVSSSVGGIGGGIGYQGIPNSVGIEFDTYNNGFPDINGNHVAIDLGGSLNSVASAPVTPRMNDGNIWNAWVDYDGTATTPTLEVRLSQSATRPTSPLLAYALDLASVLGQDNAYIGFTSGTGSASGDHDILQWQFNNEFAPIDNIDPVPEVSHFAPPVLAALVGLQMWRRRRAS